MKRFLAVVIMMCAVPLAAQTDATVWATTQKNNDGGRFAADEDVEARFDTGSGFGVSVSRMFGSRLSGELSVFRTSSGAEVRESDVRIAGLGDIELMPITAMLQFHFAPGRRVDGYVAAGLAHVMTDDLDSADLRVLGLAPVRMDDKTTSAFGAGIAISLTPRLAIAMDGRYIPLEVSGRAAGDDESVHVDVNPMLLSLGLRLRF